MLIHPTAERLDAALQALKPEVVAVIALALHPLRLRLPGPRPHVLPRREHEVLAGIRARESTVEGQHLYAERQGIEGTLSQAVRAFELRRARYRGSSKTDLQHFATAAAINLDRMAVWFAGRPLAPTRVSRFAALAT